ncbi:amidase [Erysipelothrix aquatica]|uniref:amidase n=1 Tax=Erysipelothrix aquatica TaxID=2683714 RepID=UPI001357CDFB|nr:amidase [Erysipelothrix aquatica]
MNLKQTLQALEQGDVTPKQLVQASIQAIEQNNKNFNAVVHTRFEAALSESERDFSQTVFKGTPILIKSLGHSLKGEPSTAASCLFKDMKARHTNNFVQAILDLGFIVVGQTNSPEFGFKNITDSKLYGITRNPRNRKTTPGGSSGGAAAALVAGFTPVVAASDGGGSIRIPASYTGLVGLKPTRGSIPTGPYSHRGWQGASMNFFLTQTVTDTELLFEAIKQNTVASPFNYVEEKAIPHRPLRVAYSDVSPVGSVVSDDAKTALMQTVQHLESLGHTLVYEAPDYNGMKLMETYYRVNGVETAAMFKEVELSLNRSIQKDDIELMSWVLYHYGLKVTGWEMVDALNYWDRVSDIMHQFHQSYDLYLTPTTAKAAPAVDYVYHTDAFMKKMVNIEDDANPYQVVWDMFEASLAYTPFTMLANITGQPALSLPVYKNEANEHFGVQLMAGKGNEALLFAISKQLMHEKD